jgi:hypothetical protein
MDPKPVPASGANGGEKTEVTDSAPQAILTMAGLVGGLLVGVAEARWLSNEVDKSLLRAAAAQVALSRGDDKLAATLAVAPPAEALRAAAAAKRIDVEGAWPNTTVAPARCTPRAPPHVRWPGILPPANGRFACEDHEPARSQGHGSSSTRPSG